MGGDVDEERGRGESIFKGGGGGEGGGKGGGRAVDRGSGK